MRSKEGDGVLLLASFPLLPLSGMLPGVSKIVRSFALAEVGCPRSSVVLPSTLGEWGPFRGDR
eukprot:15582621-Heterocapsa_arctica.AAC.1